MTSSRPDPRRWWALTIIADAHLVAAVGVAGAAPKATPASRSGQPGYAG